MNEEQLSIFSENPHELQDFFGKKRSWSASKHRLLLKYLQSFCYVLSGGKYPSQTLNYVDGFAGKGKYEDGMGLTSFTDASNFWKRYNANFSDTDGSPLIALKCAKIFKDENRAELNCHFSEANRKSYLELQDNCKDFEGGPAYEIYGPGEFEKLLPEILSKLNCNPTLFFLDTFGVKGVTFEKISLVNQYLRKYKGEMFVLFHNISVARHAGQSTAVTKTEKDRRAVDTYTKNLTNLLGKGSEPIWKGRWSQLKDSPQEFERWALQYFKQQITKETLIRGVTSFEIKESYADSRPKYSIVVCSNNPAKSFGELLNDFIFSERRSLFFAKSYSGIETFLENEWKKDVIDRTRDIYPRALEILRNSNWSTVKDAITRIILEIDDLGYLDRASYRNILRELYDRGHLDVRDLGEKGGITDKSCIRINI